MLNIQHTGFCLNPNTSWHFDIMKMPTVLIKKIMFYKNLIISRELSFIFLKPRVLYKT